MAKIALFIPSRIYGGAERQMALLACQAADDGHEVTLIDSRVGIVSGIINDRKDINVRVYDGSTPVTISDSVVITQASYAFCLGSMLQMTKCDVRFWFMHPLNLPHMYLSKRLGLLLGGAIRAMFGRLYSQKLLQLRGGVFFQSSDTRETVQNFYGLSFPINFTGLLSEKRDLRPVKFEGECSGFFELCWLGRLDSGSKLLVVKKILSDVACSEHLNSVSKLHIVGDGPARAELELFAGELNLSQKVIFHGHLEYSELPSIIRSCILVFAHGTSVYEGVCCHVPVAVVNFFTSASQLQQMKYRLYSDDPDLTLGYLISDHLDPKISSGRTFNDLLENIIEPNNLKKITEIQLTKLEGARNVGVDGCRLLYDAPYKFNYRADDVWLDKMFFFVRSKLINLRNIRV